MVNTLLNSMVFNEWPGLLRNLLNSKWTKEYVRKFFHQNHLNNNKKVTNRKIYFWKGIINKFTDDDVRVSD